MSFSFHCLKRSLWEPSQKKAFNFHFPKIWVDETFPYHHSDVTLLDVIYTQSCLTQKLNGIKFWFIFLHSTSNVISGSLHACICLRYTLIFHSILLYVPNQNKQFAVSSDLFCYQKNYNKVKSKHQSNNNQTKQTIKNHLTERNCFDNGILFQTMSNQTGISFQF